MKAVELGTTGASAVVAGFMLAVTPLINILFGWWLAPFLILGGILTIFTSFLHGLRRSK